MHFMCVQFYIFFSVLGLTSMAIDPISSHIISSIFHLMYVFIYLVKFGYFRK